MGNIINYAKKYGNLSFDEFLFNEVDNLILSIISYLNFDGIIEPLEHISLKKAANEYFKKYDKKEIANNIISVQYASKTLKCIKDEKRYENLSLYNYVYKFNMDKQFSALFIDLDENTTYISFEGTDDLISGWLEDGALSYTFPVLAQKDAINYINSNIPVFSKRKYILGGHSKGGNLALVAGMYANPLIRGKIIKIYSNDGPGLRLQQFESRQYKRIEKIYELIIPEYSVVGLILNHKINPIVVSSLRKGLLAHNVFSWEVVENSLVKTKLSSYSRKVNKIITKWLNMYTDEEREEFLKNIADIFKRANIDSLLDIKASKLSSLIKLIRESRELDKKSKKIILDLINTAIDNIKIDEEQEK